MEELAVKFQRFESDFSLLDRHLKTTENEAWYFWSCLRVEVFDLIATKKLQLQPKFHKKRSFTLKNLFNSAVYAVTRNPIFIKKNQKLFLNHPRRIQLEDGYFHDIYVDFLTEKEDTHLEFSFNGLHFNPINHKKSYYTDFIQLCAKIYQKLHSSAFCLAPNDTEFIGQVEIEFEIRFGFKLNLMSLLTNRYAFWYPRKALFKKFLQWKRPKVLVLVVNYGHEFLISAAQELKIPVVELQHGTIFPEHMGYSFPQSRKKYFPDYLLTFGPAWSHYTPIPLPDSQIIPIGYAYLEKFMRHDTAKKDVLVVVSQPTIGKDLAQYVLKLLSDSDFCSRVTVIYKMHPQEKLVWKEQYPELNHPQIKIAGDEPIYKLFSESKWALGVYSTALFEALAFKCHVFILDLPPAKVILKYLENSPMAKKVTTEKSLINSLAYEPLNENFDFFFTSNAKQNFDRFIRQFD